MARAESVRRRRNEQVRDTTVATASARLSASRRTVGAATPARSVDSVVVLVVVNNGGLRISTGELLVLGSTVFFALTEFISSEVLKACSIQAYVFFRNLVSSAIFFTTAVSSIIFQGTTFALPKGSIGVPRRPLPAASTR